MKHLKQIYNDESDLKCILQEIGFTLSGRATNDQSTLFLLGEGSSGKSSGNRRGYSMLFKRIAR